MEFFVKIVLCKEKLSSYIYDTNFFREERVKIVHPPFNCVKKVL